MGQTQPGPVQARRVKDRTEPNRAGPGRTKPAPALVGDPGTIRVHILIIF